LSLTGTTKWIPSFNDLLTSTAPKVNNTPLFPASTIFILFTTRNPTIIIPITAGMTIFMSEFDPFPIAGLPDLRKKPPLPPPGKLSPPPASSRGSPSGVVLLFFPGFKFILLITFEKTYVRHRYLYAYLYAVKQVEVSIYYLYTYG
jgi:hypothetical protein